ncbi:hypothetical protein ACIO13_32420 [Streptomyces sp. NPDC087425]|uniref:hypothetical protein n=1 Tax=Streptomyces sp. NPDC087425 TaxID=3365787 RepID=UPI0037F25FE5
MASLSYEILTDPAPLQVSGAGPDEQSVGTVYLVISNPTTTLVPWYSIEVRVPWGNEAGDLTLDPRDIDARVEKDYDLKYGDTPRSRWDEMAGVLTLSAPLGGRFSAGDSMVVVLDNFPVSDKEGLVLLSVEETSGRDEDMRDHPLTLSLLKQAPKVPRNFRPDPALVDTGANVVLRWDGPATLTYEIQHPDGTRELVAPGTGPGWEWSPSPDDAPQRDATYTLIATSNGGRQPGYFLTTSVALRRPEFESVTATDGLYTPWVEGTTDRGRVVLSARGAEIRDASGAPGVVAAAEAEVDGVRTTWIRGRSSDAGWVEFPATGVNVFQGPGDRRLGTVTADRADLNGVHTTWVRGVGGDAGWIEFPASGMNVFQGTGDRQWGTVAADKADLNGIHTKWVQGRGGNAGWVEFPSSGMNVFQGAGDRQWGTVAADEADVNGIHTKWVQGRDGDAGWVEFPSSGVNVFRGAGDRQWGTVAADKADLNSLATGQAQVKERLALQGDLDVAGAVVAADLTARGKLTTDHENGSLIVHGQSVFHGKVNANQHLSVRNEGVGWIMHTNDGQIAVQGNLRVHGAFRSDS